MPPNPLEILRESLAHRYLIESEVGRGGMSLVYKGRDLKHDRDVAIKVLRPEVARMLGADRFVREIQIEARLQHPHIVPLLDSGQAGDLPYCVLPFIKGPSLRTKLEMSGQLPIEEALRIVTEVGEALSHAHRAGIVHRDVKPENILMVDGQAMLADFGIARVVSTVTLDRLTSEGIVVGTPQYMSPEQADASGRIDGRSDLYALAVVFYEMLGGEPPFSGRTSDAILAKHRADAPPSLMTLRPTAPAHLVWATERALAKKPADRFPDVDGFLAALAQPDVVTRAGPGRRALRSRIALAAIGVSAVLGAIRLVWPRRPLDPLAVVVYPLRDPSQVAAAQKALDVSYAIELALDHARPLRWIHGWNLVDDPIRRDPTLLDAQLERRVARRHQAKFFIDGEIRRDRAETRVVLRLYDAGSDTVVAAEEAAAATATAEPAGLSLDATRKLLIRWLAPGRHGALRSLSQVSPAALALLLQGEREYRSAKFEEALDLFERALREDSSFGYAAVKAAQTASWLNRFDAAERAGRSIAVALRYGDRLPAQYRPFAIGLQAYFDGRAAEAVRSFQAAIAIAPEWEEAHTALGETYQHLLPNVGYGDSLAEAAFGAAVRSDSFFTPPRVHLAEIAARRDDLIGLEHHIAWLRKAGADSTVIRPRELMRTCLKRGAKGDDWNRVGPDDGALLTASLAFSAGASLPSCASAGWRALLASDSAGIRWVALLGLQGLLVSADRPGDAARLLDSARATGTSTVLFLYLMGAAAGVKGPYPDRANEAVGYAARFGPDYRSAAPHTRWALAAWHRQRGDRELVQRIADRLRVESGENRDRRLGQVSQAVSAHAALATGDTVAAIGRLRRLGTNAPRDSITYDYFEPLGLERLLLAELLLKRRAYRDALDVAAMFDHPAAIVFTMFLGRSLAIRAEAADSLGQPDLARRFRDRLKRIRSEL